MSFMRAGEAALAGDLQYPVRVVPGGFFLSVAYGQGPGLTGPLAWVRIVVSATNERAVRVSCRGCGGLPRRWRRLIESAGARCR